MEKELFGFLDHDESFELQHELQELLSKFELTFVMTRVKNDEDRDDIVAVYQFITHQNGDRYGFETPYIAEDKQLFLDQVERSIRATIEAAVPDDAPDGIDDERDEPYYIGTECNQCGTTLKRPRGVDGGPYNVWECRSCNRIYTDTPEQWEGWV